MRAMQQNDRRVEDLRWISASAGPPGIWDATPTDEVLAPSAAHEDGGRPAVLAGAVPGSAATPRYVQALVQLQEKLDSQLWVKYREDGWSCAAKHLRPIVVT